KRPAGHPLPEEGVDDDIAVPLAADEIVSDERTQGRLDSRRATKPMTRAHVGREQFASFFEYHGSQSATLPQRPSLPHAPPHRLEDRRLLRGEPAQSVMEIVERDALPAGRADLVPRLVCEALHVVRKIAREIDDGGPEARLRLDP